MSSWLRSPRRSHQSFKPLTSNRRYEDLKGNSRGTVTVCVPSSSRTGQFSMEKFSNVAWPVKVDAD